MQRQKQLQALPRISAHQRNYSRFLERQAVVEEALTWKDTPYNSQGALKGKGCSCAGLMIGIASTFGYAQAHKVNWRRYAQNPKPDEMTRIMRSHMVQVTDKNTMLPGDIMHLWFIQAPQHLAMLVWDGLIVHAHKPLGKVRIHRMDDWWLERISGVYRFPELVEDRS